jgi:putative sterol carrier protein
MPKFPSHEWVVALCEALNNSPSYAEAAKNWEGDFYFIVEPGGPLTQQAILYMDLWHGKCRLAKGITDPSGMNPAFVMSANYDTWVKVIKAELDPIQGLMTRKLKLKGNMTMIMKNVKAAQELVKCCALVPTEWA